MEIKQEEKILHIIALEAENIKRIRVVRITPDGNMIVLGGKNKQGKSSVIDAIEYALGGKPDNTNVIHRGQDKARVLVNLGDLEVVCRYTRGEDGEENRYLEVRNPDGAVYKSPQKTLDALFGKILDPVEFTERLSPKEQADELKRVCNLTERFDKIDIRRKAAFDERTIVNRELKTLEAKFNGRNEHAGVPKAEESALDISTQLTAAIEHNERMKSATALLETKSKEINQLREKCQEYTNEIEELEAKIALLRGKVTETETTIGNDERNLEEMRKALESPQCALVDTAPIQDRLTALEETNRKVRENAELRLAREQWDAKDAEAGALTKTIEGCDGEKAKLLKEAQLPIDGLEVGEDGLLLNGLPFDQASSAERIYVAFAIIAAQKPKLRVVFIREGSLLDEDSLKVIAEIAEQFSFQVWLERVSAGAECSVILEDGEAKPNLVALTGGAE